MLAMGVFCYRQTVLLLYHKPVFLYENCVSCFSFQIQSSQRKSCIHSQPLRGPKAQDNACCMLTEIIQGPSSVPFSSVLSEGIKVLDSRRPQNHMP